MSPSRLVRALALALIAVLAVGGLTATPSVAAAAKGSISGAVSLPSDFVAPKGLEVYVTATRMSDAGWEGADEVTAKKGKDGRYAYSFSKLKPGQYYVQAGAVQKVARDTYLPVDLVATFVGGSWDVEATTPISLAKDAKFVNQDISLPRGARVEGTITGPDGEGVPEAFVEASYLIPGSDDPDEDWSAGWSSLDNGYTFTDEDGRYEIIGLPDVTTRVCAEAWGADPVLLSRCWDDAVHIDDATDIPTGPAGTVTSDIDIDLPAGGAIEGTITAPDRTAARDLEDAEIVVYRESANGDWEADYDAYGALGWNSKSSTFDYEIEGVEAGTLRVCVEIWTGRTLVPTCHGADGGELGVDNGSDVSVTQGEVTGDVDVSMLTGATLSGSVTLEKGVSTKGVYVNAYNLDEDADFSTALPAVVKPSKGGTKSFTIGGLVPGDYLVEFSDENGYLTTQFWKDADRYRQATPVEIGALSETRSGISATMRSAQAITGTVTDEKRKGMDEVFVTVYAESPSGEWEDTGHWAVTDSKGRYRVGGLPAGDYKLGFDGWVGDVDLSEYWNDSPDLELADVITVKPKKTTSKIDAQLTEAGPAVTGPTPTIKGTAKVGETLTASAGTWRQNPTLTYQWKVGKVPVDSDAGEPTRYTLQPGDEKQTVTVTVIGTKALYGDSVPMTSKPTKKVAAGTIVTTEPRVEVVPDVQAQSLRAAAAPQPAPTEGQRVRAVADGWTVKVGALAPFTYQWYADGKAIKGATTEELLLSADRKLVGKKLTVKVTATAPGHTSASRTSKSVKVAKAPAPLAP